MSTIAAQADEIARLRLLIGALGYRDGDHDATVAVEAVAAYRAHLAEQVRELVPDHEGDPTTPSNWYFDGFQEAQDAVLALIDDGTGSA